MKIFVATLTGLALFSATAVYAAAPETVVKAAKSCCDVLAACCAGISCCG